ncbi:MAG TPA: TadE/TadG family type IV pilus assembly protein [Gaiellaceae bacterium]|nr:TadE/TadG family type IV pilus assembly protein [Gaiellaceae bacterium]
MVEFVLVLPLLVTLIFVVVQLGLTFSSYLRLTDVARVAARAAAVARFNGVTPCRAATTAADTAAGTLPIDAPSCAGGTRPGSAFSVTVTLPWKIDLPLLPWSFDGNLQSTATEQLE